MTESELINLGDRRRFARHGQEHIKRTGTVLHFALQEIVASGMITRRKVENFLDRHKPNEIEALCRYLGMSEDDFLEMGKRRMEQEDIVEEEDDEEEEDEYAAAEQEVDCVQLLDEQINSLKEVIIQYEIQQTGNSINFDQIKCGDLLKNLQFLREKIILAQRKRTINQDQEREFSKRLLARIIIQGGIENLSYIDNIKPLVTSILQLD